MARSALIRKENEKRKCYEKFKSLRASLKLTKKKSLSANERMEASQALQKLPKNSCLNRQRNRCMRDGRPRGIIRDLGISRIFFRELALAGFLPGVRKHSNK